MTDPKTYFSFTVESDKGTLKQIITECKVCQAFDPRSGGSHPPLINMKGLWDTGATGTVIDKDAAIKLGLKPIGKAKSFNANGHAIVNVYAINLILPNNLGFKAVTVTEGVLTGFDILIGMDIITTGDFAITNQGGKTMFSFRIPSKEKIDFREQDKAAGNGHELRKPKPKQIPKINNGMCKCGSGRKFIECHGKIR